jgi:uncharacterized protein YbjT (DUF2867 family)
MEKVRATVSRTDDNARVAMPLPKDVPLQMISVRDIGSAVAALLLDAGPTVAPVDIAGDDLTGEEIAARFADRLGVSTSYVEAPLDALG